ncbi:MAG: hypothetical protein WDM79_07225 [Terricaulis sp.]
MSQTPLEHGLAGHPSMMSREELSLLFSLARDVYSGQGIIVDAGVFLGASTLCFGHGLRASVKRAIKVKRSYKLIWSYDLCVFNEGMLRQLARPKLARMLEGAQYHSGESFEPLLRRMLKDVEDLVDLQVCDVLTARMPEGEKVEIAFLDILKTPEIESHLFRSLYPKMIPGVSIVVQQDYFFERLPYIKIRQERLAPFFDYLGAVGPTAVFRLREAIPQAYLEEEPAVSLPIEEKFRLIDQAAERVTDPGRKAMTALCKVDIALSDQGSGAAKAVLDAVKEQHSAAFSASRTGTDERSVYLQKVLRKVGKRISGE